MEQAQLIAAWEPLWPEDIGQDFAMWRSPSGIGQFTLWQHETGQQSGFEDSPNKAATRAVGHDRLSTTSKTQAWNLRAIIPC